VLHELHIAGLGVIDDLDLALHPGLNVLTGETGAGKTMVTTGLTLALGTRAAASLVRDGAKAARVQARFDAPEGADDWAEDGEVILARTVSSEGKSTARISGQLATATALASLGEHLVEVHGQHQVQRLLSSVTQTAFLDRFAGDEHLVAVATYREAFDALRHATQEYDRLREASRDRERELDLLAYQVREIEGVGPQAGESVNLAGEEMRLAHVERLIEHTAVARSALSGDDDAAGDAASAAAQALTEAAQLDPAASEIAARASGLAAELAELARDVRDYRERLAADPERLQQIRERTAELKGLQRKYGETDEDVITYLGEASERLAGLSGADERLAELAEQVERHRDDVAQRGSVVTAGRTGASGDLAAAIGRELEELGMPGAVVQVALEVQDPPGAGGFERVELRFAGGAGQTPAPLAKTASGGELSRTMLACRSVLADLDAIPTLVFDEVDAGIGGEAGLAVGRRLARLAQDRQVLVVTHLPQIACFADRHITVAKDAGVATVEVLEDGERIAELSRMLAGMAESAGAVSHAQELLDEAVRVKAAV
jgi:DNA repair protein RecN (Recombination protein N)